MLARLRSLKAPRLFGVVVIGASLVLGGAYYKQVNCQSEYNQAFTESLIARSGASAVRQDAADAAILAAGKPVLHPPKTPAEVAKAQAEYVALFTTFAKAKEANDAARAANPYPAIPHC